MFLTPEEIEQLTGYDACQRVRIRRWLENKSIPFTVNRLGDPVVMRSAVEPSTNSEPQPNFDWIKKSA